jgi:AcrR family transcriptional regulator
MKRARALGAKGEETRSAILRAALASFRKRGFEATTMRDVAKDAGVALGSAYYYFPSKESLVLAYYEATQIEHERLLATTPRDEHETLQQRLQVLVHGKLDLLRRDRKLLGAIFRTVADPSDRASPFAHETEELRARSAAPFREALEREPFDDEIRRIGATALWALQLGLLLYFIHDDSPKQHKTRALADGAIALVVQLLRAAPMLGPDFLRPLHLLLEGAGLIVPDSPDARAARDLKTASARA